MDRIDTTARARILRSGATASSGFLRGSVVDVVTSTRATSLEDVVETEPVTHFMSQCLALVVVSSRASRHLEQRISMR